MLPTMGNGRGSPASPLGAPPTCHDERRKRRSAEIRNSLRLGLLLGGLVGINVYVFFFNRGTAPREVLKPASTVQGDRGAQGRCAPSRRTRPVAPAAPALAGGVPARSARACRRRARAGRRRRPTGAGHRSRPVPRPAAVPIAARPAARCVQIPFAPPPEDGGEPPTTMRTALGREEDRRLRHAGQVLAREGFGQRRRRGRRGARAACATPS